MSADATIAFEVLTGFTATGQSVHVGYESRVRDVALAKIDRAPHPPICYVLVDGIQIGRVSERRHDTMVCMMEQCCRKD